MTALVVHNIEVLGHFDDGCVSSIQCGERGGVSGHFGALEQFWLKIVHEELI